MQLTAFYNTFSLSVPYYNRHEKDCFMNMIVHESPFIDSIYHLSYDQYPIKDDFFFRGSPSLHECIVLNPECAVVTFTIDDKV